MRSLPGLPRTFRGRILAIILAVAIVPLVLPGVWLAGAAARSGEALLAARLEEGIDGAAYRLGVSWTRERSGLQDLADTAAVREAAIRADTTVPPVARDWLARKPGIRRLTLRSADGNTVWALEPAGVAGIGINAAVPVHEERFGRRVGTLTATLSPEALLGPGSPAITGMVLGAFELESTTALSALPFDPLLLLESRFALGPEEWLTARRRLADPPVELVAAAALTPYVAPFQAAARSGLLVLGTIAGGALLLALRLTARQTRSLEHLAKAADAVRLGDWDRRVAGHGTDEIGRVAEAFDSMTDSLQRTMAELADRRALAAVGEFAATLAHEIRNPLTSIQVDLQMVEERMPAEDQAGRTMQARALAEIRRLDATLAGALNTARSGRMKESLVDLREILRSAADACRPMMGADRALDLLADRQVLVRGDRDALVQLTLNLLLNAAQASRIGGRVSATCRADAANALILIEDDGPGIPASELERVFEPLYTTRPGGTGLGLAVARRLARAHGGDLTLENTAGRGARAVVTLPAASAPALQPEPGT